MTTKVDEATRATSNIRIDEATRLVAERLRARRGLRSLAALATQLIREAAYWELIHADEQKENRP